MADKNFSERAQQDARDMLLHFIDEIAEKARDDEEVSDDYNNDYPGGDSYHHETHVDKDYNLQEAALLLDQLSDHEETDNGLWEGQEPRQAIATQAAFTYGNAVSSYWSSYIETLNEDYLAGEASEDVREGLARIYVLLIGHFSADESYPETEEAKFAKTALEQIHIGNGADHALVFADWLEDKDTSGYHKGVADDLRTACKLTEVPEEEEEEDDDDEPGEDDETEGEGEGGA